MITMPPRHGKSMLASEFFPAWYIGRNPDHYVVTATYAQDLADDFGRKVKNQIEDEGFKAIFPGVGLADDSKSAKRFHIEGRWQRRHRTYYDAARRVFMRSALAGRSPVAARIYC